MSSNQKLSVWSWWTFFQLIFINQLLLLNAKLPPKTSWLFAQTERKSADSTEQHEATMAGRTPSRRPRYQWVESLALTDWVGGWGAHVKNKLMEVEIELSQSKSLKCIKVVTLRILIVIRLVAERPVNFS